MLVKLTQDKVDAIVYRVLWYFNKLVSIILVGFGQVVVDEFGLFVIFVALVIADVDFLPRRQDENFGVGMFLAGGVKKRGVTVADIVHIGQNVGNATIQENKVVRFPQGVVVLLFSAFEQQFAKQQRIFQEELLNPLFFGFHRHFARNLGVTAVPFFYQSVDDSGLAGSGSANDYDDFFLHYFRNKAQTYSILSAFEKINQVKNMIIVKKSQSARGLSRLKPLYLLLFFENGRQDQSLLRAS